jgi:hypothetical protein
MAAMQYGVLTYMTIRRSVHYQQRSKQMSPQYAAALETFRTAGSFFRKIQTAYRARECDDATFLSARKTYLEASAAFDVAEAEEDKRFPV